MFSASVVDYLSEFPRTNEDWVRLAFMVKSGFKWLGRTVYDHTMEASILLWQGMHHTVVVIKALWELTFPCLQTAAQFLLSPRGGCLVGGIASLSLWRFSMSYTCEENTLMRHSFSLAALFCSAMTAVYACEMGVVPQLFIR